MKTKSIEKTQFKEVKVDGRESLFISETSANHADSMKMLEENGLKALTYQEALAEIDKNPELKEQLKEKWFYLAGKGLGESGYRTFDNEGKLTKGKGDLEKTVYLWDGENPLSLNVRTDGLARINERRFNLVAYNGPQYVAPVVVGVRADREAVAPKIVAPELVFEFRSAVAKMDSATHCGVLNAEITEVAKKVLRAIE